jgi:hypothetical protein
MSGTYSITVQEARGLVASSADIDKLAVVMGCSSAGTGLSSFFLSGSAAIAARGKGDAVDTLCQIIEQKQASGSSGNKLPAAMYTTPIATPGSCGAVDSTGKTGLTVVTADASVAPYGTYDAYLRFITGGTIGTAGPTLVWSLDGGRTESSVVALGTAAEYLIASGNVKFLFTTATIVAGDIVRCRTVAPAPDADGVGAAFTALAAGSVQFAILVCDFDLTTSPATLVAAITSGLSTLAAAGKRVVALCRSRLPDYATSETDAAWSTDCATDYAALTDSRILVRAAYGLVSDAMTARQYRRSNLQQFAADVARVGRSIWPDCPNDQPMANFKLVDGNGLFVGHDEGPRGSSTGLSNDSLGNRLSCDMRLPDAARLEDVFTTVPWVLFATDERIRTLPVRRIANAMERVAISAGNTALGGNLGYTPAVGATPEQLTDSSRRALHAIIYNALATEFRTDIQNASAASLDTGLVQVSQAVTVTGGNLLNVPVTIAPLVKGQLLSLAITLAVQM